MTARIVNLGDFLAGLREDVNATDKLAFDAIRKIGLGILTRVVFASPVDTGRFRGNWQIDIGSPASGEVERLDRYGASTVAEANIKVSGVNSFAPVFITNNVPYAAKLNEGHSKQAPAGFVEAAIDAEVAPLGIRFS